MVFCFLQHIACPGLSCGRIRIPQPGSDFGDTLIGQHDRRGGIRDNRAGSCDDNNCPVEKVIPNDASFVLPNPRVLHARVAQITSTKASRRSARAIERQRSIRRESDPSFPPMISSYRFGCRFTRTCSPAATDAAMTMSCVAPGRPTQMFCRIVPRSTGSPSTHTRRSFAGTQL